MNQDSGNRWALMREAGELSVMGLTLVLATAIGYYIGYRIERHWPHITPWGGVIGALVGIIAGFVEMFRSVRRITRQMEKRNTRSTSSHESQSRDAS